MLCTARRLTGLLALALLAVAALAAGTVRGAAAVGDGGGGAAPKQEPVEALTKKLAAVKTAAELEQLAKNQLPQSSERLHCPAVPVKYQPDRLRQLTDAIDAVLAANKRAKVVDPAGVQLLKQLRADVVSGKALEPAECKELLKQVVAVASRGEAASPGASPIKRLASKSGASKTHAVQGKKDAATPTITTKPGTAKVRRPGTKPVTPGGVSTPKKRGAKANKSGAKALAPQLLERAAAAVEDRDGNEVAGDQLPSDDAAPAFLNLVFLRYYLALCLGVERVTLSFQGVVAPVRRHAELNVWASSEHIRLMNYLVTEKGDHLDTNERMLAAATEWAERLDNLMFSVHLSSGDNGDASTALRNWLRDLHTTFDPSNLREYPSVLVQGAGPVGLAAALHARHGGAKRVYVREARNEYVRQHIISVNPGLGRANWDPALASNSAGGYKNWSPADDREGLEKTLDDLAGAPRDHAALQQIFPWHAVGHIQRYMMISEVEKLLCLVAHVVGVSFSFNTSPSEDRGGTQHTPQHYVDTVAGYAKDHALLAPIQGQCPSQAIVGAAIPHVDAGVTVDNTESLYDVVVIAEGVNSKSRAKYLKRSYNFLEDDDAVRCAEGAGTSDDAQDKNILATPKVFFNGGMELKAPKAKDVCGAAGGAQKSFGERADPKCKNLAPGLARPSEVMRRGAGLVTVAFIIKRDDLEGKAEPDKLYPCGGMPALRNAAGKANGVENEYSRTGGFAKVADTSDASSRARSIGAHVLHYKAYSPPSGPPYCQLEVGFRATAGDLLDRAVCGFNLNREKSSTVGEHGGKTLRDLELMRRVFDRVFVDKSVKGDTLSDYVLTPANQDAAKSMFKRVVEFKEWKMTSRMSMATRHKDANYPWPQVGQIYYRSGVKDQPDHRRAQLFVALGDAARDALPDLGVGANDGGANAAEFGKLVKELTKYGHPANRANPALDDFKKTRNEMCKYIKRHAEHVRNTVFQFHRGLQSKLFEQGYDNEVTFSLHKAANNLRYDETGTFAP